MSNQASTVPTNPTCPDCGTPLASGALAGMCPACLLKSGVAGDSVTQAGRVPFVPPTVEKLTALFPALEILEFIGKGGMGAVYKARQRQLDRIVALKVLPPALGDDTTFAERFAREARALAKLNHPGIVTLYEFGHVTQPTGPLFYILMEFVDGVNLRHLLSGGRISPREALAIVPQICDALQFAHDRGIVHRDIKPENLLIDRRGAVKVADFGLAKLIEPGGADLPVSPDDRAAQQHGPTGVMGTPRYMAPEQSERPSEVDHRADIYALGVVFYQMLTGELPAKELRPPSTKVQIDVRLDEIVLRALERNPSQRYAAVSEIKTQMNRLQEPPSPSAKPNFQNSPPRTDDRPESGLGLTAAALVVVCWFAAFPFVAFVADSLRRPNALAIAAFFMAMLLPFLSLLAKRQASAWMADDAGRLWMRAFAGVGGTFALPAAGFAMFFFHAFLSERGGWNPAPAEALIVPTIFLGAALLPAATTVLWGASGTTRRASLRMAVASSAAVIALVLMFGGGTAALNRAKLMQARQTADVTQANLESRAASPGNDQAKDKPSPSASSGKANVIVLTRATNNLVGTTKDIRTVNVWSDSLLLPGESLKASSDRTGAGKQTDNSYFSVMNRKGDTKTTTGLSWFFREDDGFGASEVDEATAQIRDRMTQRPLSLIPGSPIELFRVTNRHGSVIAGAMTFIRTPQTPIAVGKKVETTVQLRTVLGSLLFINANVPPGYRLQATDNSTSIADGQAHTSIPGVGETSVHWFPPSLKFERDSRKTLFAQIEQLAARGPLTVVAGQPAEVFSITNQSGDVYKGFLELVGPKDGATGP